VPCSLVFAPWIEDLAARGITGGCGGGNYCPTNPVRRDQMAVFLLKTKYGSAYVPPPCDGDFADVACPSPFADWIEQLAAEQITGGCGGSNYCPLNPNTRGQMAVFITKTFGLQ
jgi:S-layer homology domain